MNEVDSPRRIAMRVRRLKRAVLNAAERRRPVPQPLFWSLFHTELKEIKRRKERERKLSQLL